MPMEEMHYISVKHQQYMRQIENNEKETLPKDSFEAGGDRESSIIIVEQNSQQSNIILCDGDLEIL